LENLCVIYITRKVVGVVLTQANHTRSVYVYLRCEHGYVPACVMGSCADTLAIVFTIQHTVGKGSKESRITK